MTKPNHAAPQRMLMLDAMRGIAAVAVVFLHVAGPLTPFGRSYLAVDFFFILSGFVLTPIFERAPAEGAILLMARRLARLWPMMSIGTMLGIGVAVFAGERVDATLIVCGLLFVPVLSATRAIFPFNGPQWSLVAELLANVVHLVVLRRMQTAGLVAIAVGAWLALVIVAMVHGDLTQGPFTETWTLGLWRVAFGYTAGVLLARTRQTWQHGLAARLPWFTAPLALLLILVVPAATGLSAQWADPLAVAAFMAVVAIGAQAHVPPTLQRSAIWMGQLSFPLYALHLPFVTLARTFDGRTIGGIQGLPLFMAILCAVVIAHLATKSWLAKGFSLAFLERALAFGATRRTPQPARAHQRT